MCANPKYNIGKLLRQKPGKLTQNTYAICIELGITEKTLYNWINTPRGASFSIPSDHFLKLLEIFNVNSTDLING